MGLRRLLASFGVVIVASVGLPLAADAAIALSVGPLNLNPTQGLPGSSFTASQDVSPATARALCPQWLVLFDGTVPSPIDGNFTSPTRTATMQVPFNAAPGGHTVTSFCSDGKTSSNVGSTTFTVLGDTTTTTTTTTTTSTTTTTIATTTTASTTTTVATTTTAKATTTTSKPTTTAPSTTVATTTTAATTTSSTTTTLPTTTTSPTTTATAEVRVLALDKPSVAPGGDVVATGQGCDSDAAVTLEIAGEEVGQTTADSDGSFSTPIDVPDVDPGRLEVTARCGPLLTTNLDIVLASSVSGGTSILLVLAFFVIVLFALLWYGLQTRRS